MNNIFYVVLTIVAGILVTIQGPINVQLGKTIGNSYWSTLMTFIVGGLFMLIFALVTKQTTSVGTEQSFKLWQLLGGIFGAIYVVSIIIVMPVLGVGTATVLLLFVQLVTSMIFDHFGWLGTQIRPFDVYRAVGVILMAIGIYLINKK
ncbi:DMT family transporter [Pseudostreptobacillus sp.]